jgi:hypothetical protein
VFDKLTNRSGNPELDCIQKFKLQLVSIKPIFELSYLSAYATTTIIWKKKERTKIGFTLHQQYIHVGNCTCPKIVGLLL